MNKLQEPVLIVDDEADIRDLMEMTLMKMGLRVDTAWSALPKAVITATGVSSINSSMYWTTSRPEPSGIRISVNTNE